jgi:hypothetical protein
MCAGPTLYARSNRFFHRGLWKISCDIKYVVPRSGYQETVCTSWTPFPMSAENDVDVRWRSTLLLVFIRISRIASCRNRIQIHVTVQRWWTIKLIKFRIRSYYYQWSNQAHRCVMRAISPMIPVTSKHVVTNKIAWWWYWESIYSLHIMAVVLDVLGLVITITGL